MTSKQPQPRPWQEIHAVHQTNAARTADGLHQRGNATDDATESLWSHIGAGLIGSILAVAAAAFASAVELHRIRKILERQQHSNTIASWNAIGYLIPKQGGEPVAAGPFNPTEAEDVLCTVDPKNAAGEQIGGDFSWATNNNSAITDLQVAPDKKSAKAVTALGTIDAIVVVTQVATGVTTTFSIQRTVTPPDTTIAAWNESGQVVPK